MHKVDSLVLSFFSMCCCCEDFFLPEEIIEAVREVRKAQHSHHTIIGKIDTSFKKIYDELGRIKYGATQSIRSNIQLEPSQIQENFDVYRTEIRWVKSAFYFGILGFIGSLLFLSNETKSFLGVNFPNHLALGVSIFSLFAFPVLAMLTTVAMQKYCKKSAETNKPFLNPLKLIRVTMLSVVFDALYQQKLKLERPAAPELASARAPLLPSPLSLASSGDEADRDTHSNDSSDDENSIERDDHLDGTGGTRVTLKNNPMEW